MGKEKKSGWNHLNMIVISVNGWVGFTFLMILQICIFVVQTQLLSGFQASLAIM